MHSLALVLVPHDSARAIVRPLVARDAAVAARIETLLFRYEQPDEQIWRVDDLRGFQFDWCVVGGRWAGWGRRVRGRMVRQKLQPSRKPIPRFLEPDAVWSADLRDVRLGSADYPLAIITPHGEWVDCPGVLIFGKATMRQRKAKTAWLKKIRRIMDAYPECVAVAVDYHY